jgi:D-alanyl-D-alanine carboxypeptidase/D-alanyl-D-alanine-endopeptidase (penicillin-binding protein 4)
MKVIQSWRKTLAILTLSTIAWTNPALVKAENAAQLEEELENESIEIVVPAPESSTIPGTSNQKICPASLEASIDEIINRSAFRNGKWGILVQSLDGRTTFYSHNANKYLIPASNMKIITTAAALQKFDPHSSIRSKSLQDWIAVTNLRSNNFYAETLFKYVGGTNVIKDALTQLGVDASGYRIADGSGLSRRNLVTPQTLVTVLKAIYSTPAKDAFMSSLPVAGISGTLKNRLRKTPAQGAIHAKTGTLKGVRALSGYLDHPEYGTMVFSIIGNHSSSQGKALVKAIDEIVVRLSLLSPCDK